MRTVTGCAVVLVCLAGGMACKEGGAEQKSSSKVEAPKFPPRASRLWTQAEVEAWIRADLGLGETSLTPGSDGSYTGTGKDEGGVKYKLKVTQRPGQIVLDHESPARTATGQVTKGQRRFGE